MIRAWLLFVVLGAGLLRADNPTMDSLTFYGRWDRRAPDRAITVNTGSYVLAHFSGSSISAKFDLSVNQPPLPTMAWRIDNGDWQEAEIAPDMKLADGLAPGEHTLWLMVRGLDEHQNRWTPPLIASVTFLGLELPADGKMLPPLDAWIHPALKMEFLGDSITEGVLVTGPRPNKSSWPWQTNALLSYSAQTAMLLDAQWRQVGFGATGIDHGGSGRSAPAMKSFDFFYAGCPRDDWQPDVVVVNQGTNNDKSPPEKYEPLYIQYLAMIRKAYPNAKIAALRPFSGRQEAAVKQAADAARAAGDAHVFYIDTTGWYDSSHPLHPNAKACTLIAAKLSEAIKTQVLAAP